MKSLCTKLQMTSVLLVLGAAAQGCGVELGKDDPGAPGSRPNPVTLTRSYQHVLRYNCDGSLRDDAIESVRSPEVWRTVRPNSGAQITDSSFTNRRNGDSAHPITYTTFLVKYHTAEGGLKVEKGLNIIDYRFNACANPPNAAPENCLTQTLLEEGTVSLDVTYVEETLAGTLVEHVPCPSPSGSP